MERKTLTASADQLVSAIASIGYDPEVALCDLLDNSIDAKAKNVDLTFVSDSSNDGDPDAIIAYVIADDGLGMDRDAVVNAFTLGTKRYRPPGSLGKFGLGMKSAGLSLGSRITIISKKTGAELIAGILSLEEISEDYFIQLGSPSERELDIWNRHRRQDESGTVLYIDGVQESAPARQSFVKYFRRHVGNIFHLFLEDQENPLVINVDGDAVQPIDPLFIAEASGNGDLPPQLSNWTGQTVHWLMHDVDFNLGIDNVNPTRIAATHLIHPPSFTTERRAKAQHYQIDADPYTRRLRHGFYIYRNRRVIVLAERFMGIVPQDQKAWAFRGRLMFDESADQALALDVKKRKCFLPKGARNALRSAINSYTTLSQNAWKEAGEHVDRVRGRNSDSTANEVIENSGVASLGYSPATDPSVIVDSAARAQAQTRIANVTLRDAGLGSEAVEETLRQGQYVQTVQGMRGNVLWASVPSVQLGLHQTLVNVQNSWASTAYAAAQNDQRLKVVLHQIFTMLARADLELRTSPVPQVSIVDVEKILDRYRKAVSRIAEEMADSFEAQLNDPDLTLTDSQNSN
ncbi:MAG TPA: ATP-binding protein [Devosia sp.]|jgi:hypothetical protein|nr:ATP-binding protein [Devosia sp.]